ncbi:MAG TPA: hypothetical protein VK939_16005 [Longimicrobiales bacterium]|nr:hypothetical protein [Longimicrobiales bacterium]
MMKLLTVALILASSMVGRHDPGACLVTGSVSAADGDRARAACDVARARFQDLFGVAAPALEIVLREQPGYRVSDVGAGARVYWPTSAALGGSARTGSDPARPAQEQWREVLPHEAMHALLAAHFFGAGDDLSAPYGTPLPDWFEEGVAIWAESDLYRGVRMAQARRLEPRFRVLPEILAGAHPAASNPALLAARDGAALPADDAAVWAFYPQSLAVLGFVYDAGGTSAIQALAARLLGESRDTDTLAGLPGLPATADEVIAAWEAWLPASGRSGAVVGRP